MNRFGLDINTNWYVVIHLLSHRAQPTKHSTTTQRQNKRKRWQSGFDSICLRRRSVCSSLAGFFFFTQIFFRFWKTNSFIQEPKSQEHGCVANIKNNMQQAKHLYHSLSLQHFNYIWIWNLIVRIVLRAYHREERVRTK